MIFQVCVCVLHSVYMSACIHVRFVCKHVGAVYTVYGPVPHSA